MTTPARTIMVTPLYTSHEHFEEGGRRTHDTGDDETPRCGTSLAHLLASTGDPREVSVETVHLHIDCGRCLRIVIGRILGA